MAFDELKALTDDSKLATDYLAKLASIGGEFGLHLVLSTQYPQIKMLGSAELKRNITTRLCGKVDDAHAAGTAGAAGAVDGARARAVGTGVAGGQSGPSRERSRSLVSRFPR